MVGLTDESLTRGEAESLLRQAKQMNPGPWVRHSLYVGQAARLIAEKCGELDPDRAYISGLLHDIGRRYGITNMRHALDGYNFLKEMGYNSLSKICMTHSFPTAHIDDASGNWDCDKSEYEFVREYIQTVEYDDYDRLIQLCDSIALPNGFSLIEKRLVDVALRHGINCRTVEKWKAFLDIKSRFDVKIGNSIYSVLPGIVETTFGFSIHEMPFMGGEAN